MLHEHDKKRLTLSKLEFYKSAEDLAEDYTYLSDNDKLKIQLIDSKATFDYEDGHRNYTCLLLTEPQEINTYTKVLDDNLIPYICHDITQSVIRNDLNIEKILRKHVNGTNILDYNIFIRELNEWILGNLDLDQILDRINEKGIDSLRDVDIEFLKKV